MKTLNQYITEKILINKNTKFDNQSNLINIIHHIFGYGDYKKDDLIEIDNIIQKLNILDKSIKSIYYSHRLPDNELNKLMSLTKDVNFSPFDPDIYDEYCGSHNYIHWEFWSKQSKHANHNMKDSFGFNNENNIICIVIISEEFESMQFYIKLK